MPPFPEPDFDFTYDLNDEILALRQWRDAQPGRAIPQKADDKLLLASWNIANFGDEDQSRDPKDIQLLAEVISWFDLVAIQEVKENLTEFKRLQQALGSNYAALMSDMGGNNERMVYIYDKRQVRLLELAGEIAIPPAAQRHIKLKGITQKFSGFDRNPYVVAFGCGSQEFTVVNAHLYFGSSSSRSRNRRALESYALGRWADLRAKRGRAYSDKVIVIGDLNMPKAEPGDVIFDALTKRGLKLPDHQSRIGTTISEGKHFDQLAFLPGDAGKALISDGVFDFDGGIFADLWHQRSEKDFDAFVRYRLSDHRPIWAQFEAGPLAPGPNI